jgi:hypothetical protein
MNAPLSLRPQGCPAGIDPRRWRAALVARVEHHRLVVERLIAALDRMEVDADFEPSLAAPEACLSRAWGWGPGPVGMPGDGTQEHWADGGTLDLEQDAADDDHADNPVTLNPDRRSRDRRFYHSTRKLHLVQGGAGNDA